MAVSPERIQQHLEEVEAAAEDVISDRQEIVTLDRRRNTNREALRHLKTNKLASQSTSNKSWICVGNMFFKLPNTVVVDCIEKEQKQLDTEINNLRNGLRSKVNHLNDLEAKQKTVGTNLKPLSQDEWKAVKQVLGR
ncbi:p53 and DNA damage-regulated protein 1-like isoform X2 [Penaeus japonicus]|uniref:p53 and DNA damage-regulated protein 1-like isoform X2 n=1 Tax=Penaeus japonicus TaxID=27405 RepID=UPI001C70B6EB|nr:p53 and DNA damage-regulated protein 1-like isoform X2 [Penaeus japonicus]XP_042874989.1 p53 and DNA damage-regulated protein 1-like isoform X2 [Penaeus japonicus]XP_042874995.1 p53 and DNA damage-regulated protein 1-like isoform X2 [Penaeus japonicus]